MRRRNLVKILGLSLLVVIGVMAVSASSAQAKWLLLKGGSSVLELKLKAKLPLVKLLVPEPGLETHCLGGTAAFTQKLNATHTAQTTSFTLALSGCEDKYWSYACEVGSAGQADGTILMEGTGQAGMGAGAEEYYFDESSSEFANIEYRGEECPLTEIDGRIGGKLQLDASNALADTKTKTTTILDKGITVGGNPATLHAGVPEPVKATIEEATGTTWGLHLVGL